MFSDRNYSRRLKAKALREQAAQIAFDRSHPERIPNGEEEVFGYLTNFHKGLPHNHLGEVEHSAYRALLTSLTTGDPNDFENIPLHFSPENDGRKLVNPQCGLAFDLEGPDSHSMMIPPAPRIDGAENSGEMGELYWMALMRDIPFSDYRKNKGLVKDAVESLNTEFSDFRGPKEKSSVTPQTLFRGVAYNNSNDSFASEVVQGELKGPYISQFLLKGNADLTFNHEEADGFIRFGTLRIDQRNRVAKPKLDFMGNLDDWLDVQNGAARNPNDSSLFEEKPKFLRNLRDLATYVHFDQLYQAYFNACIYLLEARYPLNAGNPYHGLTQSITQDGFGVFGGPHILSLLTEVSTRALKAVWYEKWFVHRRFRPEAFGGMLHIHLTGKKSYPMINDEIIQSLTNGKLSKCFNKKTGYFLPMAYPEGSPMHPAYGAGHATVAGACVTMLKAWFKDDENFMMPSSGGKFSIFEACEDGLSLTEYKGKDASHLTVGSELNKLAANIAIGRNAGGVHWRSDYTESIKLGEQVAIGILQEQSLTLNELRVDGSKPYIEFTCFDGSRCRVENGEVSKTPRNLGGRVNTRSLESTPIPDRRGNPGEPSANIG